MGPTASYASRLHAYLDEVWQLRHFWISLVQLDLRNRYKRSILGVGWSLLNPIAMTAVLCVVFAHIMQVEMKEYAPFLMSGVALWGFITAVVSEGCQTFYLAEGYIRSERTPLAVFSLRTLLGSMFHFLLILAVTLGLTMLLKGLPNPIAIASLIPTLILLSIFGWSVATIMGVAAAYFPDIQHLAAIGLQMLFYLTPILYPPEMLHARGIGVVLRWNPLGAIVDMVRTPILSGTFGSLDSYVIAAGFTLVLSVVAVVVLVRSEKRLVFAL